MSHYSPSVPVAEAVAVAVPDDEKEVMNCTALPSTTYNISPRTVNHRNIGS